MVNRRLIAVVGGSGSGKTWLATKLTKSFCGEAVHLCLDNFYRDLSHLTDQQRKLVNFDDPESIDWDTLRKVLEALENGETTPVPMYDFANHTRKHESIKLESRPVVILEGLWLLHPEWLRKKFALSVFIDCSEDVRLSRRMKRDVIRRGRTEESVRKQFAEHVLPMHARYVEPQRERSTLCVSSPLSEKELDELMLACQA